MANMEGVFDRRDAEFFFNRYVDPFTKDLVEFDLQHPNLILCYRTSYTTYENLCSAFRPALERLVYWALLKIDRELGYLNSFDNELDYNVGISDDDSRYAITDPINRHVIDIEVLRPFITMRSLLGRHGTIDEVRELIVEEGSWDYIVEEKDLCGILVRSISDQWNEVERENFTAGYPHYRQFIDNGGIMFLRRDEDSATADVPSDDNKDGDFKPNASADSNKHRNERRATNGASI